MNRHETDTLPLVAQCKDNTCPSFNVLFCVHYRVLIELPKNAVFVNLFEVLLGREIDSFIVDLDFHRRIKN